MMKISVLNLVPVRQGQDAPAAMASMLALARQAEALGYVRFWIAEHHNMPNLLSCATQVLIGHVLAHTQTIRVGSGGVMLPNHSPLVVAEQYGTLATLYPDRVDLGVGRAPGTDMRTAEALRRYRRERPDEFPDDLRELLRYFEPVDEQGPVKAWFCADMQLPVYLLGSSTDSAYLAAEMGLPYVFAGHFAPRFLESAVDIYRSMFRPSARCQKPHFILCTNVIVADSDEEAARLATSQQQLFLSVVRNARQPLMPPVQDMSTLWTPAEAAQVMQMQACSLVGSPQSVAAQLQVLRERIRPDELMTVSYIFDEQKQHASLRHFADIVAAADQ